MKIVTLEEKFYAEVVIEARWLYDANQTKWNPKLYVKNALDDVKEELISTFVNHANEPVDLDQQRSGRIYVLEVRKMSGTFWEKLELNHFPLDVQQLSLQIVAGCSLDECILVENRFESSTVNREAFIGQIVCTDPKMARHRFSSFSSTRMVSLRTHRSSFHHYHR